MRGHNSRGRLRNSAVEYVVSDAGCWIWQGAKLRSGYGYRVKDGAHVYAHREYYERSKGPIPYDLTVDHLCRNRACVNPAHLEAVTRGENVRRGATAKLTWAVADEIRTALGSTRALAERYGVSHNMIGRIKRGQSWAR